MRIAFEAKRFFESGTGFGTYSRTLVGDLAKYFPENRYFLFAPESERNMAMVSRAHSTEIDRVVSYASVRVVAPPSKGKFYWKLIGARKALREHQIDLYHGLTQQIPRSIRRTKIPKILSIQDLIYRHFPDLFPGERLNFIDQQLRKACAISDHIVAISQSTKSDLIKFFSIAPSKISVIYPACDRRYRIQLPTSRQEKIKNKYQLPDRYLLYVGSITQRKNLLTIVKAMKFIPTKERIPLVVIGQQTPYTHSVLTYAEQNGLSEFLIFPKNVTTQDLPAIYQGSRIFLYTSLYEGFGIPVLEALASGVPVITSNTSALPEAAGPDSHLIEPLSAEQTADSIMQITWERNLREEMINNGYLYCQQFENSEVTKLIFSLYNTLLSRE